MSNVIEVTVKSQKGKCVFGHKVGDKTVFDGKSVKGDICYGTLTVLLPRIFAMIHGLEFPWAKDGVLSIACLDPENPVIFEIRRIRK